jgi:DNA polymerase I-like protein with 3'-5' exonuclease and polymerase domains
MDAHFTLKVFNVLKEKLDEMEVSKFYGQVLAPANTVFVEPEWSGIKVCPNKIKSIGKSLNDSIIDVHDSLYDYPQLIKEENLSSSRDLQGVLYTKDKGFAFYPPDKTEKGSPSVSAPTLEILLGQIKKELISRG